PCPFRSRSRPRAPSASGASRRSVRSGRAWPTCSEAATAGGAGPRIDGPCSALLDARPMRTAVLVLVALLAFGAVVRGADETTSSTTQPARAPVEQQTEIQGTAPDLEGRWLLLVTVGLAQSAKRVIPSVLDVTKKDGALE